MGLSNSGISRRACRSKGTGEGYRFKNATAGVCAATIWIAQATRNRRMIHLSIANDTSAMAGVMKNLDAIESGGFRGASKSDQ